MSEVSSGSEMIFDDEQVRRRSRTSSISNAMDTCLDAAADAAASAPVEADSSRHMTIPQEIANSLSMLGPMVVSFRCWTVWPDAPVTVALVALGQLLHLPFSMMYHIQMARKITGMDPVDNIYRVLDQMFILVASAIFTFATTGCIWYGALASLLAILYAKWLLEDLGDVQAGRPQKPHKGGPPGRRKNILVMLIFQLFPICLRGDWLSFLGCILSFGAGVLVFVKYPFGGWSHSIFHACGIPSAHFLCCGAHGVRSWSWHQKLLTPNWQPCLFL